MCLADPTQLPRYPQKSEGKKTKALDNAVSSCRCENGEVTILKNGDQETQRLREMWSEKQKMLLKR